MHEDTLLIWNPFRCEVKDVQFDMQEEFIELTNSSSDTDIHETQDLVTFSIYILACNCATLIFN